MTIWSVIGPVLIVPVWDWLGLSRASSAYIDFDYRYWPLSRPRLISVLVLMLAVIPVCAFANPDHPPLWTLMIAFIALAAWAIIALRDVKAQHRTGYRDPPGYSEREPD